MYRAWPACLLDMLDEAEPLERLPETPPFRLHLVGGEDAIGIRAYGEKGGIAKIEEASEADHDVEAESQDGESEGVRGGVNDAFIGEDEGKAEAEGEDDEEESSAPRPPLCPFPEARRSSALVDPRGRVRLLKLRLSHGGPLLGFRGSRASEQTGRPEDQDQHQDREDDHISPSHLEILPSERFDEADQHAAQHGARQIADAAEHGRGEGTQARSVADGEIGIIIVEAEDEARGAG